MTGLAPRGRPTLRRAPPPDFDVAAVVVQRLAVLLSAGIAPASAWRHAASGIASPAVAEIVRAGAEGGGIGRELAARVLEARSGTPPAERPAWAALAAAWWVAVESGAPLGPTLQRFAESLRSLAESLREVEVALAGPVATSRIVLALPVVGLLLGAVLGFDAPRILVTTPAGWVCLVAGGALIGVGIRWNRRLIAAARRSDAAPGLALELLAIAVSGGASVERARRVTDDALSAAGFAGFDAQAEAVLTFARTAGAPIAALLQAEAEDQRRRARSDARRRAAELGTRLLLPLGLCILPAFVAVGVAPIVIAILSSTVGSL